MRCQKRAGCKQRRRGGNERRDGQRHELAVMTTAARRRRRRQRQLDGRLASCGRRGRGDVDWTGRRRPRSERHRRRRVGDAGTRRYGVDGRGVVSCTRGL